MFQRLRTGNWFAIPLRLIVGFGFMQHGYAKLAKGPQVFASILQVLHVPNPFLMAWLTIVTELLGGAAIIFGVLIPLASVPMIVVLMVAIFSVHLRYGFSSIKLLAVTSNGITFGPPGYECNLLYIACLVALVFGGPGPFAVDNLLVKRSDRGLCV